MNFGLPVNRCGLVEGTKIADGFTQDITFVGPEALSRLREFDRELPAIRRAAKR